MAQMDPSAADSFSCADQLRAGRWNTSVPVAVHDQDLPDSNTAGMAVCDVGRALSWPQIVSSFDAG